MRPFVNLFADTKCVVWNIQLGPYMEVKVKIGFTIDVSKIVSELSYLREAGSKENRRLGNQCYTADGLGNEVEL